MTLSPLSVLSFISFTERLKWESVTLFWQPVHYGDRLPIRRDLFRQLSASSGMVGRLSTLGLNLFQDVVTGFWLWRTTFFSGGFGRLGSGFIPDLFFKFSDLRWGFLIHFVTNPHVIEDMQLNLFYKANICPSKSTTINGLGIKRFI